MMMNNQESKFNFVGYKPTTYQAAVHKLINKTRNTGAIISILAPRQVGKSLMNTNILLDTAINQRGSFSIYIAPSFKQTSKAYKELLNAVLGSGIIEKKNEHEFILEFINGSSIMFLSAMQSVESLRGYTVKNGGVLIVDEAAFIADSIYQEALIHFTRVHKATQILTSTPKFKSGFYFTSYNHGLLKRKNFYSINFNDYDLSKLLTPDDIENFRVILPKNIFLSEVMGQFLDTDGMVFENVKRCIYRTELKDKKVSYVGIDWATGTGGAGDDTVVTTMNIHKEVIYQYIYNNLSPTKQVEKIADLLTSFGKHKINCQAEVNSIGSVYNDLLRSKVGRNVKIIDFTTTNESKNTIINKLQVRFENNNIRIPDDAYLLNQLNTFECIFNPKTRVIRYSAPEGLHDDRVMSLAICADCADTYTVNTNYIFSII